ncbi:hypothetical protein [Halobellus rubicundus]|uniref:DUF4129 domain-containing protein n=1 Tax=Halobellus rubicundus TaxID=2996466 RepID=A0ABD5MCV9_9EURY
MGGDRAQQTANNSTIQHENPEETSGDGDLEAVQNWLSGRMGETLINCTQRTTLSEEVACSRLDEEYPEWLSNYVTTARDTDGSGDDRRASQFNETQQAHDEYRDAVREFRETRQEYEEAREDGDRERARELARDLSRAATGVNETAGTLTERFEQLENSTGIEFGPAIRSTQGVAQNATAIATTVREREFVATTLEVTANRTSIAFDAPVLLTGQLRTQDAPVSNRTVTLAVGRQTDTVRTDANGRFELLYRPVLLPQSADSVSVAYRPAPRSLYERSEAAVNITVRGTASTVSATLSETTAVYGDTVRVTGQLRADGRGVGNMPLRVAFADTALRVRTGPEGSYTASVDVPADVTPGNQSVSVELAVRERAVEQTSATRTVRVRSSTTNLTLRPEEITSERILVTAVLVTDEGRQVRGEPVQLTAENGSRTVTTDADGASTAALDVTNQTGNLTVTAAYRPSGGNLDSSTARLRVSVPASATTADGTQTEGASDGNGDGANGGFPGTNPTRWIVAFAAVGFVLAGGTAVAARAYGIRPRDVLGRLPLGALGLFGTGPGQAAETGDGDESGNDEESAEAPSTTDDVSGAGDETSVVNDAEGLLAEGRTDEAVITIYEAVRAKFVDQYELLPGVTHWELVDRLRGHGTDEVDESVVGLTTAYEQAAYAPDALEADEATAAIETAERLLSQTDQFL